MFDSSFSFGNFGSSAIGGSSRPGSKITEAVAGVVITVLTAALIGSVVGNVVQANDNKKQLQQVEQLGLIIKHLKAEIEELTKKQRALTIWAFKKRKKLDQEIAGRTLLLQRVEGYRNNPLPFNSFGSFKNGGLM